MASAQYRSILSPGLLVAGLLWLGLGLALGLALAAATGSTPLAWPAVSGLSLAMALLTLFVAAIVATFSLRYMRTDPQPARFFWMLGALVVAVLAVLFAASLPVLAAGWCASGWMLAALIGHARHWPEARAAGRRARLTFLAGDTALLAALGILAWHAGSLQLEPALAAARTLPGPLSLVAALLLVGAAAARCALPPCAGWLLSSMTAPTPVSALMHAGLVNAGGFLLIRFAPVLEAAPAARIAAIAIGLTGALYGIGIMLVRPDVKRALAGSTVSQMGFMVMSCGLGAYGAALWHIIAHGLFKAWLFLGSGAVIGMKPAAAPPALSGRASLGIAAGTLALALALLATGRIDGALLPLLLGVATAIATLWATLGTTPGRALPGRTRAMLLLAVVALIAGHGAGLALAEHAAGRDAPALLSGWSVLGLLAILLGAWVWQQHRLAAGLGLPLRLYVHLINAGALPAAGKGEAQ